jgi:hypothetical protein
VSPLKGLWIFIAHFHTAYAVGYSYAAATRLYGMSHEIFQEFRLARPSHAGDKTSVTEAV